MVENLGLVSAGIFAALAAMLIMGVPLAFSSGALAVVLTLNFFGLDSLFILANRSYSFFDSYVLVAVPFFIFMASVLERSGLARDLYDAARLFSGKSPGGAGVVTVFVGIVIGAIIGVAGGEIVLMGLIALPQLLRMGYQRKLAIGLVCATGALGSMIPPAITLVFYGMLGNVPVGDLFLASFLPGFLLAAIYIAYVRIRCGLNPALGPAPTDAELDVPLAEKLRRFRGCGFALAILLLVLGSIYLGIASVTESAAIGAAGTVLAVWLRGDLTRSMLRDALMTTLGACGMVMWLVLGTNALVGVYNLLGGIDYMRQQLASLPFPPFMVILMMVGVWMVLDFFIDWIGILMLTLPIFLPTATALGYDPVWFGTVFNLAMQIAYISPPFAPACFYLKSVAPPDITMDEIFSAMWPFMALQALCLFLVMAFPDIALFLPRIL